MIVCVFCLRCCTRVHLCVATLVFIVHMFVNIAHGFCFRVFSLLVCACMLVLRVLMYWFAFDCCKVVFHITRVCRLRVCIVFVYLVCLSGFLCLFCVRLCMQLPLFVARLRFMLHVCVDCMPCFFFRVFLWMVCFCLLVLRVIVYAFAFVCCKVAFLVLRACGLHVWFGFVLLDCLFVLVCL